MEINATYETQINPQPPYFSHPLHWSLLQRILMVYRGILTIDWNFNLGLPNKQRDENVNDDNWEKQSIVGQYISSSAAMGQLRLLKLYSVIWLRYVP